MSSIDTDCRLEKRQGCHSKKNREESVKIILGDLMKKTSFSADPWTQRSQIISKILSKPFERTRLQRPSQMGD